MQLIFDKKRKRRESHNAVERRRRDNINERIYELSTLLPERDATKNNKGTILRKSVDHIRLLHDKLNQYQQRVTELESMLEMYRLRWGDLTLPQHHHPSYQQQLQHSSNATITSDSSSPLVSTNAVTSTTAVTMAAIQPHQLTNTTAITHHSKS
ncbi:Myc-type, basic helix-loop-helix domain-containing protein [Mycotypha africana]|uniref:Myc-type, basic helix-loop-helix domain-containing protein n=1 Tax=Mycotypha africana TaxID=64632 RepID=UPI002301FA01|nr:Myc-type, basic helix-loop-helix domain-containing protein [Mycotypha africana]KAI8977466.1 Myc-type, basic helix-loop-helix domain-containing protein [Mycotypha africana]